MRRRYLLNPDGEEPATRQRDGDGSFEPFFESHAQKLFGTLCLVVGSREEGEDLMQEAFLRVFQKWDAVQGMEDQAGYLYRTAFNLWKSRRRRAIRAARHGLLGHSPSDMFTGIEDRVDVGHALGALTARQRAAVVLTHLLGYSSGEAARMMGVRSATVRSLASQGRKALRTRLKTD